MKKIPLADIYIGMTRAYSQKITEADIQGFANLSGDKNPVHLSETYAKNSRFKKRIAHGLLSASYFSGLFGTELPGEGCVYVSQELKFLRPVYIGDTVIAEIIVKSINLEKCRVIFDTYCSVNEKKVIVGKAEIYAPE